LPDDFNDVPLLAVVDGLDAVDAAVGRLVVVADLGFVGAPEVGDVRQDSERTLSWCSWNAAAPRLPTASIQSWTVRMRGVGVPSAAMRMGIRRASGRRARESRCGPCWPAGDGRVDGFDELIEGGCRGQAGTAAGASWRGQGRQQGGGEGEQADGWRMGNCTDRTRD